jgi:phosphosulfolactate phosphohydrolase-like enzyme
MIKTTLNGQEDGKFPITSFRQAGIISKPISSTDVGTRLIVNNTNGFSVGDTVNGSLSGASAIVRLIEVDSNIVWLSNVLGTFSQSDTLTNGIVSSNINRVFSSVKLPLIVPVAAASEIEYGSGNLLYQSNRVLINRGADQSEEVRMVITF